LVHLERPIASRICENFLWTIPFGGARILGYPLSCLSLSPHRRFCGSVSTIVSFYNSEPFESTGLYSPGKPKEPDLSTESKQGKPKGREDTGAPCPTCFLGESRGQLRCDRKADHDKRARVEPWTRKHRKEWTFNWTSPPCRCGGKIKAAIFNVKSERVDPVLPQCSQDRLVPSASIRGQILTPL